MATISNNKCAHSTRTYTHCHTHSHTPDYLMCRLVEATVLVGSTLSSHAQVSVLYAGVCACVRLHMCMHVHLWFVHVCACVHVCLLTHYTRSYWKWLRDIIGCMCTMRGMFPPSLSFPLLLCSLSRTFTHTPRSFQSSPTCTHEHTQHSLCTCAYNNVCILCYAHPRTLTRAHFSTATFLCELRLTHTDAHSSHALSHARVRALSHALSHACSTLLCTQSRNFPVRVAALLLRCAAFHVLSRHQTRPA